MMKKVDIAILGFGTVGQGVAKIVYDKANQWEKKCGAEISIKKVLVRKVGKKRDIELPGGVLTTDWNEIINDPSIKVIVELMGGIEPARTYVSEGLKKGKHIVTANKDLLAEYGEEIFELSKKVKLDLYFEASVAGGIPIIAPLKQSLASNDIKEVMGIVNGTTNYILTRMLKDGMSYEEALKGAQELGYAEADPTADVGGYDAARKIAILASIAFHTRVKLKDVYVEGITGITPEDLRHAAELGYVIKLLGIAREENNEIEARVHPVLVPVKHPLAGVNDSFNAVYVYGDAVGETMFFGRGAGRMPTASSVMGDVVEVVNNIVNDCNGRVTCTCYEKKKIKPIQEVSSNFYLRLHVSDKPGVLASIATVFSEYGVSLASVIQKNGKQRNDVAELVVVTHLVKEKDMQDAIKVIKEMSSTRRIDNLIRVEKIKD